MILITSAAYVNEEFQAEFGRLPPSFLPVGNVRLYQRQISELRQGFPSEEILLSLPATFSIPIRDQLILASSSVDTIMIDDALDLKASISMALEALPPQSGPIRILHGDTLLQEFPTNLDAIGVVDTQDDYSWEIEKRNGRTDEVWCGYFSFSDQLLLRHILRKNGINFVEAVGNYSAECPMERIHTPSWLDFGHINTYYRNRAEITTSRAFNGLQFERGWLKKTSSDSSKMAAEISWFENIPPEMNIYCPQTRRASKVSGQTNSYFTEYLTLPPLNEIYVHGRNSPSFWDRIFHLCNEFFESTLLSQFNEPTCIQIRQSYTGLVRKKTHRRLTEFCKQNEIKLLELPIIFNGRRATSLNNIVEICIDLALKEDSVPCISHGDFCFSNILYDARGNRIKIIDPRGLDDDGIQTIYGDIRYDLSKLSHSVIGLYDHIISGAAQIETKISSDCCVIDFNIPIDDRILSIQKIFNEYIFAGIIEPKNVMPLTILHFISMLPLHADNKDRQWALLANSLRLYYEYIDNGDK